MPRGTCNRGIEFEDSAGACTHINIGFCKVDAHIIRQVGVIKYKIGKGLLSILWLIYIGGDRLGYRLGLDISNMMATLYYVESCTLHGVRFGFQ